MDNFGPVDKLWIVKNFGSYPQLIHSGRKATSQSYPQLINRVMHSGIYATPQSYPQLMHRVIHIEKSVAYIQQNPVAKTGLGGRRPGPDFNYYVWSSPAITSEYTILGNGASI